MTAGRLILLAAEPGSLDVVLGEHLPADRPLIVVSWDAPSSGVARTLSGAQIIVVGADAPGTVERGLIAAGGAGAARLLRRTAPGRLLESFSPLHRSRLFAARAARHPEWIPGAGDLVIALDQSAALTAWRAVRRTPGAQGMLGLAAGLASTRSASAGTPPSVDDR